MSVSTRMPSLHGQCGSHTGDEDACLKEQHHKTCCTKAPSLLSVESVLTDIFTLILTSRDSSTTSTTTTTTTRCPTITTCTITSASTRQSDEVVVAEGDDDGGDGGDGGDDGGDGGDGDGGDCGGSSLCEGSNKILPRLLDDLCTLWSQRQAVYVEVRGRTRKAESRAGLGVLLELWAIQVVAKRSPAPPPCPTRLLLQAIRSHLHFSQIRSWQESDHTHSQFDLLYRVCGVEEREGFDNVRHVPVHHTFPLFPLFPKTPPPHSTLLVSVSSLPRLPCIPHQLISTTTFVGGGMSGGVSSGSDHTSDNSILRSTIPGHVVSQCSVDLDNSYPFSPPHPSPLSPKFLSGLADKLNFDPSLLSPECAPSISRLTEGLASLILESNCHTHPVTETAPCAPGSPAPFLSDYEGSCVKRRSCTLACKSAVPRARVQRCNSAPVAVSNLYLLGTFEESILNGRLEACGYVEGFAAELAASGTFHPPHITLPLTAAFYNIHDNHGGTSPYLGHVDLTSVGKRGYQVPRRGTVQVTLFNPNRTVVKIYIVAYDFDDMPPSSQTFLRQRTLSYPLLPTSMGRGSRGADQTPSLHYLIHLSFLCSKSSRLYLHKEIRMIFARRAPDTVPGDHHVTLHTSTEGPKDPKYSPADLPR